MTGQPAMRDIFKPFTWWFAFLILFFYLSIFSLSQSYLVHCYSETDGLPSAFVYGITQDHQGRMWFATRAGIAVQYKNKFPSCKLASSRVWLYGENWIGWFDEKNFKMTRYPPGLFLSGKNRSVNMLPDYCRGVYVGDLYLLNYFNYNTGSWQLLDTPNGLIGGGANSLYIDFEKNIWIACERGVSKISSRRFTSFQRDHGLLEDEVTALLEYEPGKFILGHNNGITFYDGKEFLQVPFSWEESALPVCRVLDIQMDANKDIRMAASWAGLAKVNFRFPHRITWYGTAHGLPRKIICLWIDQQTNRLWVGTEKGIFLRMPDHPKPRQRPEFVFMNIKELQGHYPRRIYGDSGKLRYIAGHNSGVFIYDEQNHRWKNYTFPDDEKANGIYAITKNSSGRLLIGTTAGLFILENETLIKFKANGFQVDRPVYFILEDHKMRPWIGTDNGVICRDGKKISRYSIKEGLIGQETNRAAAITDTGGRIFYGMFQYLSQKRHASLLEKQVEERTHQLQAAEQQYRSLFEESKDVVFITTPEGKIIDMNPAGLELFGYSSKEEAISANSVLEIYNNAEDRAAFREEISGGNESILLVDDETEITETAKKIVEKLGYHVIGKSSSIEALSLFKKAPLQFDIILSDLTMPHMTGLQLAREIKRIRIDIPIVILSGYSLDMTVGQIKALGVSDFINKPINRNKLAGVVRRVLDKRQRTDDRI